MSRTIVLSFFFFFLLTLNASAHNFCLIKPGGWDRDEVTDLLAKPLTSVSKENAALVREMVNALMSPMTLPEYQNNTSGVGIKRMSRVTLDAKGWVTKVYAPAVRNKGIQQEFGTTMLKAIDLIVNDEQQKVIAQVNASMVLAEFAGKTDEAGIVDLLVQLIEKPPAARSTEGKPNRGVTLYAFRAIKNLLARPKRPFKDAAVAKLAEGLIKFIETPPPGNAATDTAVAEGFKLLRRDAVRALSYVGKPSFAQGKIRPAFTLFKVMTGMGVAPTSRLAYRLDERVAATWGLMTQQLNPADKYDADYGTYFMGATIYELARWHDIEKQETQKRYPYKIFALRLSKALKTLQANAKGAVVDSFVKQTSVMMERILLERQANPADIQNWLNANAKAIQGKSLFTGDASTVFKPPQ